MSLSVTSVSTRCRADRGSSMSEGRQFGSKLTIAVRLAARTRAATSSAPGGRTVASDPVCTQVTVGSGQLWAIPGKRCQAISNV
jgi:hypothetical protein